MARKNSLGCGTVIIGLIGLAMAAKYWYVLVAIGFAALAIWGIIKALKSWSIEIGNAATPIERHLDNGNTMVTDSLSGLSRSIETGNTDTSIAKHFVDNCDGTVTDSHTGLSWMRCAMGQTWDGIACKGVATLCTWKQAKALPLPYSFAGRNDWRLPTCDELKSIVEPHQKGPAINTDIFSQTTSLDFWSSSPYDKDSIHAWIFDFSVGVAYLSNRIIGRSVRLVRGGQDIEKVAASEVGTAKKAADAEVAANSITNTPAPIVISGTEANTLINHHTPQNNPELEKSLDRNNTNVKADQVNAAIEKDLAKEKAAAEVTINIINRLKTTLIDTEKRRILDTKETAIQKRVAQINAEIENLLAFEKIVASAVVAAEKAAVAKVTAKIGASEKKVQIIKRLFAVLDCVRTQRILDAEKAAVSERVAQANAEIERILATEKAAVSDVAAAVKSTDEVALQKTTEEIEQIDNQFNVILAPIETQWILDSEDMSMPEHVVQKDAEILPISENEKTVVSADAADTAKKQSEKCDLCNTTGFHNILRLDPYCISCHKKSLSTNTIATTSIVTASASAPIASPPFDTFEKEIAETIKQYDFVLTNKMALLKTGDLWFDEKTQKRRLKTGSVKVYEWLLPFMPLEVAKLCELEQIVAWGLNSVSAISKQLRVLIRERRKIKEPYDDLLCALYSSCILTDLVKTLNFEGPINKMACNIDIHELHNIHIDYSTMGYHYIESLLKTDIKWLLEVFGEPIAHKSFDALWPSIRQNAVSRYCWEELRISNESANSYRRTETSMVEWLRNRVSSNLRYYRESWERRNEWLGRNDEWLKQKIAREAQFAADKPVTVKTAVLVKQHGYAIPVLPKPTQKFSLDMDSIETKLAETVAVSAILKDIFSEDAPVPPQTAVSDSTTTEASITGLDAESFSFMQALASKHIWARDELEKLAGHHSLMLDGTLDSINDASYDHFGGPFFEGDDPIEINTEFAKEIAA